MIDFAKVCLCTYLSSFGLESSYFLCLICSEMKRLDALEVFCTLSDPNMIGRSYFMII